MTQAKFKVLVAVGSSPAKVCSIGSFARREALAFQNAGIHCEVLQPDSNGQYPICASVEQLPDAILYHAPSLHDRRRPWLFMANARTLKKAFPRAAFVPVVHEFSEAPLHWKVRQCILLRYGDGGVVNTGLDFNGLKAVHPNLIRLRLSPTVQLERTPRTLDELVKQRARERVALSVELGLDLKRRWVVHPGLVTPGKGVDALRNFLPALDEDTQLIVMGGMGPTQADFDFAQAVLTELGAKMPGRFRYLQAAEDALFVRVLLASDMALLPYDVGVSERRSSFLAAMACGARVWTTTGRYSLEMNLAKSGAYLMDVQSWKNDSGGAVKSFKDALCERPAIADDRRMRAIEWSSDFAWEKRVSKLIPYLQTIFSKKSK